MRTAPPHSSAGQATDERAGEGDAETEREREPEQHPQHERAIDEAHDRVGEQVLGVALLVGHRLAAEDPADVRVEQAAERATPAAAVVDVRAVRIAVLIGELVVLAVVGDPLDHRPLDRRRAERGQQRRAARGSVLKLRCVSSRWKPTVMPTPGER